MTCSLVPAQTCIKNTTRFYLSTLRFVCWFGISVPVGGMRLLWFARLHLLLSAVFGRSSLLYRSFLLLLSLHRHGCSHSSCHRSVLFLPVSKNEKRFTHIFFFIVLVVCLTKPQRPLLFTKCCTADSDSPGVSPALLPHVRSSSLTVTNLFIVTT